MALPRGRAGNYERYLVPRIFAPWAEDLVEAAALRAGERVLDIACGTGIVARIAARRLGNRGSIVGLDTSAPMLATARVAATAEGAAVEWREGDALDQPFTDGAFEAPAVPTGITVFPRQASRVAGDAPRAETGREDRS